MNRVLGLAAALSVLSASPASAERMFQLTSPAAACAPALAETGKPLTLPGTLDDAARGALVSALFLALHDPSGVDTWPQKEIEAAPPCQVARFDADERIWTISAAAAPGPLRWVRGPSDDQGFFFLVKAPGLADAQAWNRGGRQGLPVASAPPLYLLVGRAMGANFVVRAYDGPPSARQLADDVAGLVEGQLAPLAYHDPVGDAVSLFVPTASGLQSEILRPQDIAAASGFAALFFPDEHFFKAGEDDAYVMLGSGFACPEAYGKFRRELVGVLDPTPDSLSLSCNLETDTGTTIVYVTRRPDAAGDKALWEQTIKDLERETGVARKLTNPPTGPRQVMQAGRNWIDSNGVVQVLFFLRRGEYVYEIRQQHPPEETTSGGESLIAILEQIDLPDPRTADGWRARR